jgi:uncharacterized protein YndB with AHSA1/START domain
MGNLARGPPLMTDLNHRIFVEAEPREVFDHVATGEGLSRWWTPSVRAEGPTDIARYTLGFDGGDTTAALETDTRQPPDEVVFECVDGIEDWVGTRLVFRLEPTEGGTFVGFNHEGWENTDWYFAACNTVWGHLMFVLKSVVEAGVSDPFFDG